VSVRTSKQDCVDAENAISTVRGNHDLQGGTIWYDSCGILFFFEVHGTLLPLSALCSWFDEAPGAFGSV
jgi:hypothetical protein